MSGATNLACSALKPAPKQSDVSLGDVAELTLSVGFIIGGTAIEAAGVVIGVGGCLIEGVFIGPRGCIQAGYVGYCIFDKGYGVAITGWKLVLFGEYPALGPPSLLCGA